MNRYNIYCTEAQTKKAVELGASVHIISTYEPTLNPMYIQLDVSCVAAQPQYTYMRLPTAEQMIGWLEEQIDNIDVLKENNGTWVYMFYPTNSSSYEMKRDYHSRKEATLAAIDAALDYLIKNK